MVVVTKSRLPKVAVSHGEVALSRKRMVGAGYPKGSETEGHKRGRVTLKEAV